MTLITTDAWDELALGDVIADVLPFLSQATWFLRADKGLFELSNLTIPPATPGDPVGAIVDQGPQANNFTQPTSGKRGVFEKPYNNQAPAVRGDGATTCLQSVPGVVGTVSGFTHVIAGRFRTLTGVGQDAFGVRDGGNYSSGDFSVFGITIASGQHFFTEVAHAAGSSALAIGPLADLLPHVFTIRFSAGGLLELRIDGTLAVSVADTGAALVLTNVAEFFSIRNGGIVFADFDMYQSAFFPSHFSDAQTAQVEAAVAAMTYVYPITRTNVNMGLLAFDGGTGVLLPTGSVLAVWTDGSGDGTNDSKIFSSVSPNMGSTWSGASLKISDVSFGCDVQGYLSLVAGNRLLMAWQLNDLSTGGKGARLALWQDNGAGAPTIISIATPAGYQTATFTLTGHVREITPGGQLVSLAFSINTVSGHFDSFLVTSFDHGLTWSFLRVVAAGSATPHDWSEGDLLIYSPTSALIILRDNNGPGIALTRSTNGLVTWSAPVFFGGLVGVTPSLTLLADGVTVASISDRTSGNNIDLYRSVDGGATFTGPLVEFVDTSFLNQAGVIELSPGVLALIRPGTSAVGIFFDKLGEANLL
jgi:hypothetical protein